MEIKIPVKELAFIKNVKETIVVLLDHPRLVCETLLKHKATDKANTARGRDKMV